MTTPRAAAAQFVTALERHLEAIERRSGENDAAVNDSFNALREACLAYDEALYDTFDEVLPFEVVDYVEDDDEDDEDEDDEEDEDDDDLEDIEPLDEN